MKKILLCLTILALSISATSAYATEHKHHGAEQILRLKGETGMAISLLGGANTAHIGSMNVVKLNDFEVVDPTNPDALSGVSFNSLTVGTNFYAGGNVEKNFSYNFNDILSDNNTRPKPGSIIKIQALLELLFGQFGDGSNGG